MFTSLDGGEFKLGSKDRHANFPRTADWGKKGPGMIKPNYEPWDKYEKKYDFIKTYENAKSLVVGKGNLERYNYWLNTFYYAKYQGNVGCILADMERLNGQIAKSKSKDEKIKLANELVLKRSEVAKVWEKMGDCLMQTVSTNGEMGTIANLEQHNLGSLNQIQQYDTVLKELLGNIPEIKLSSAYKGETRIIMPTRQTIVKQGESLLAKVRILSSQKIIAVKVFYKALNEKNYAEKVLKNINRNVYQLEINPEEYNQSSFTYYVEVTTGTKTTRFPQSAPEAVTVW